MSSNRSDDGPKGREAIEEIVRRLGGIAETVQDAIKSNGGTNGGTSDFTIDTPLGPLSGRYGVSVKSARGGAGARQPASPRRSPSDGPAATPAAHEPMVDAFDEPEAFVVTADIPGLRLEDVFVSCEPGHLVLRIGGGAPFTRRIAFATLTAEHSPRVRMSNGILEIRVIKDLSL